MPVSDPDSFFATLTAAVNDFVLHGFDNEQRLRHWVDRIRTAALRDTVPEAEMQSRMRLALTQAFDRAVNDGGLLAAHPGMNRFTLEMVKPQLRDELTRRIMASTDLIRLNREEAISTTLRRFQGWATSIPTGGQPKADRIALKTDIRKGLAQLDFETRRVAIDQGAKFLANLSDIVAQSGGAIAGVWHSRWRVPNYRYRPEHRERDGKVYAIRGNWAIRNGLMKVGPAGYMDDITKPAEEVFCFPCDSEINFADGVEVAYRRWYSGELTEIVVDSGETLRATPNHPVLTSKGWVAIGSLNEGDDVIHISNDVDDSFQCDEDQSVSLISDVFAALSVAGLTKEVAGSGEQFHGDGRNGNVDVVYATRPLSFGIKSGGDEGGSKFNLTETDYFTAGRRPFNFLGFTHTFSASRLAHRLCAFFTPLWRSSSKKVSHYLRSVLTHRCVGCCGNLFSFFGSTICESNLISVGCRTNIYSCIDKSKGHDSYSCTEFFSYFKGAISRFVHLDNLRAIYDFSYHAAVSEPRFPGSISSSDVSSVEIAILDPEDTSRLCESLPFESKSVRVVQVGRKVFSGHIYNLQTRDGWYVTNGIITHNCSCRYEYLHAIRYLPDEMLTRKGHEELAKIDERTAA